jgi:hypothetical protein
VGHAATVPVMNALREAVARVPSVRVVVEHAVTPDGFRVPAGVRVEVESRVRAQVADAAGQGVVERGTVEAPAGARGAAGSGHFPAGESAVGRGAAVDAVRGVEQHGADAAAGGRHVASTDVVEHPVHAHHGDDVRGRSEHGGGHGEQQTGHGDHAGGDVERGGARGDSAGAVHDHDPGTPERGPGETSRLRASAGDEYWRPLSHEEIQNLAVVRDGSHIRADGSLTPNTWYRTGEHEYLYRTNEHGHIDRVIAENLQLKTHIGRLRYVRRTLGKLFGDHAGHLIADWFGGSPKLDNLVSQFKHVNIREYGALERQWAAALRADPPGHVAIDMRVDTDVSTGRPEGFKITSVVNGVRTTKSFSQ